MTDQRHQTIYVQKGYCRSFENLSKC